MIQLFSVMMESAPKTLSFVVNDYNDLIPVTTRMMKSKERLATIVGGREGTVRFLELALMLQKH